MADPTVGGEEDPREIRFQKITDVITFLLQQQQTNVNCDDDFDAAEHALNLYSSYAQFEDDEAEKEFDNQGTLINWNTKVDVRTPPSLMPLLDRASFFKRLASAKLQVGTLQENGSIVWSMAGQDDLRDFLPDDKEFQLSAMHHRLWRQRGLDHQPESIMGREAAFDSFDGCVPVEKGEDVFWKLEIGTAVGFPFGEDVENGTCILREHHRQVLFVAMSWVLQNGIANGLTAVDPTTPPPAVVAAICGSAGIGKSRALIFVIWFLLQKRSPFLLEAGNKEHRFMSLVRPRNDTVRFVPVRMAQYLLQMDRSVFCIVDPAQGQWGARTAPSPLLSMKGPLAFTCPSLDPGHLPRGDKEATTLMRFSLSPWTSTQARAVRSYFSVEGEILDESTIDQRFEVVGGVPRALFRKKTFSARKQIIVDDEVSEHAMGLLKVLLHDRDRHLLVAKVPQALLTHFSKWPFTQDHLPDIGKDRCIWVDFLSRQGEKRYGDELFEKMRTSISKYDDYGSASMFFERWVGMTLTSRATELMVKYRLCRFAYDTAKKEVVVSADVKIPTAKKLVRHTDEALLFASLAESTDPQFFPNVGEVFEAPRGTAVYDFAVNKRWFVNATTGRSHPIPTSGLANLVRAVGASATDPLHLVFFVLNESLAMAYAQRGRESITGDLQQPNVDPAKVTSLRSLATGGCTNDKIKSVAIVLNIALQGKGKKRRKVQGSLLLTEVTDADIAPSELLRRILTAVGLPQGTDKKVEKWERFTNFVSGLVGDDPFGDLQLDESAVVQHVIAVVPW